MENQPSNSQNIERRIIINFEVEGSHGWPEAGVFSSEPYLASEHRHLFKVRVEKVVNHNDRAIEFISEKRRLRDIFKGMGQDIGNGFIKFGASSCEQLAWEFLILADVDSVEVYEDGENGGRVARC